jgi:hypothetical protein
MKAGTGKSLRAQRALLAWLAVVASAPAFAAIPPSERAVLQAIYANTNGGGWLNNTGWNGAPGTECLWYGVFCDPGQTTVTYIGLSGNNLVGALTPLDALPNLNGFSAGYNHLSGSIPPFGQMTKLETFDVNRNQLTGPIPSLAGLSSIYDFEVWENQLTGALPSLAGLTTLGTFYAFNNQLTGSIPSLDGLVNLTEFYVYENKLTGSIPVFTGLVNLNDFEADHNLLTGPIPDLAGVPIKVLNVGANQLDGVVPPAPSGLQSGVSKLCVNYFPATSYVDDAGWDAATGVTPWYQTCKIVFADGFGP